jgi:hypothetical protein
MCTWLPVASNMYAAACNAPSFDNTATLAQERQRRSLLTALAAATGPIALSLPIAFLLANVLMDKTSMMGVLPPPLGPAVPDIIIAAIVGLSTVLAAGSIGVWWAALLPRRKLQVRCLRRIFAFTGLLLAQASSAETGNACC